MSGLNGSFEKVTRNMVENLELNFNDFKKEIRREFSQLKETNEKLYNHLSNRIPAWATGLIALLTSIVSAMVGLNFS